MHNICESPRTKIWLLLFGSKKYDEFWEISSRVVNKVGKEYFYQMFYDDGLDDSSWRIDKKILINVDWNINDFQNIPERIILDEIITILRYYPELPKFKNDFVHKCPKFLSTLRSILHGSIVNLWFDL